MSPVVSCVFLSFPEFKKVNREMLNYSPQRAQRAGGIVRVLQIFGHVYDFPTWSELGTNYEAKLPNFGGKKYLEEFKNYL